MSLSASFLGAISISLIIDNQLQIRTVIYGSIAGGITGGASSYFTSNVVYAILVGFIGGGTQAIIHNLFDKRLIK
jgi:ammonia channel protein AmtB